MEHFLNFNIFREVYEVILIFNCHSRVSGNPNISSKMDSHFRGNDKADEITRVASYQV